MYLFYYPYKTSHTLSLTIDVTTFEITFVKKLKLIIYKLKMSIDADVYMKEDCRESSKSNP